jgi:hypothetical protein
MIIDDDEQYSYAFEQGRRAARVGLPITSNPHLDSQPLAVAAWTDGFRSIDTTRFSLDHRFRIYEEGRMAGERGDPALVSPYLDDDDPEPLELWLLGYAPHV